MAHPTKIATCCYCGTRAALVLGASGRHELSCGTCGAPLHNLKMIRKPEQAASADLRPAAVSHLAQPKSKPKSKQKSKSKSTIKVLKPTKPSKRKKPRKSRLKWLFEEAKDVLEDIFD